jgi:hypothetical protein
MFKRASWLSVTPEPERELPRAVATMTHGSEPPPATVAAERERVEQLVLHGSQRQWLAYLSGVRELIDRHAGATDAEVAHARARATAVLANHHNLLLGLGGSAAQRTSEERARLNLLAAQELCTTTTPEEAS